jgi:hypothetical protein
LATFDISAAIAMIGTACLGPNWNTSTGSSMMDEPALMTPLTAPETRSTMRTKAQVATTFELIGGASCHQTSSRTALTLAHQSSLMSPA